MFLTGMARVRVVVVVVVDRKLLLPVTGLAKGLVRGDRDARGDVLCARSSYDITRSGVRRVTTRRGRDTWL